MHMAEDASQDIANQIDGSQPERQLERELPAVTRGACIFSSTEVHDIKMRLQLSSGPLKSCSRITDLNEN